MTRSARPSATKPVPGTPTPPVRVLVFARDPVPGQVKTRLIPELGAAGACALYRLLLDHVVNEARRAEVGAVELWWDRAPSAAARSRWNPDGPLRIQAGADLGARMDAALTATLAAGALPILVGSDLPGLTLQHCRDAARALRAGADAVLAPALDGGYGLVGLARPWPRGFEAMPWGTDRIMALTRQRAVAGGLQLKELAPVWDVDDAADLARLDAAPDFRDWRRRVTAA